jgi:predicted amidohydrolase
MLGAGLRRRASLKTLTVAAVQSGWVPGNVAVNLSNMIKHIRDVSSVSRDVDIICFCETALPGFDVRYWRELAEPIPGPSTSKLSEVVSEVKKWVCIGSIIEKEKNVLYNACVLLSPEGKIAFKYRKTHPWLTLEPVRPANEYNIFSDSKLGKIGFMICYDGFFPEVPRSLVWNGAQVIIWPAMIFHPHEHMWRTIAMARAIENQCFVVGINGCGYQAGMSLVGHSLFVDPTGSVLSEAGDGEAVLIETLFLDEVREVREKGTKRGNKLLKHLKEMKKTYEIYARDTSRIPL